MELLIKELLKNKRLLTFQKSLYYALKCIQITLAVLNCANLYFAGLITGSIIKWVNLLFNYTLPKNTPDWFTFYVVILYLIVLAALLIPCTLLLEKIDTSFNINYLKSQIENINREIANNILLTASGNTNINSESIDNKEKKLSPKNGYLLGLQNIKPAKSIIKKLNKNDRGNETKNFIEPYITSGDLQNFDYQQINVVTNESKEGKPINVIDNLNEIFVSKENIENILEETEFEQIDSILPKISASDYIERNKIMQDIGLRGEYFILKYEIGGLIKVNRADLANKVRHISKDQGDYVGYDILSYDKNGNEKYIEVKTSVNGYTTDFFLTVNEMNKIKKLENYFIYRVFDFDIQIERGNLYIVNCKNDFIDYFTIQPTQYKVSPRKNVGN